MTKTKYILLIVGMTLGISSCEVTEPDRLTFVDDKEIYNNIAKIRSVLNNVYSGLPNGYSDIGTSWLSAGCDESEEVNNAELVQNLNMGNITPYSNPDDIWNRSYATIRNANLFIQSTDTITWKELEYSNPQEYTLRTDLVKQYKAEARFLIAYFYFELIKRYGGVPIVNEVIDKESEWISRFPRKSFEECVDFIVTTCDEAAVDLLPVHDTGNYGRATQAAALALKARTLLYAASDLYNQPGNNDPLLGYVDGDRQSRWIQAAAANRAVITYAPAYAFHPTYQGISLLGSTKSNEVILERRYPTSNTFEKANTAVGFPLGQTGSCPSGNLVDAYEHTVNKIFDWNNPAHAANPYANRDPRLAKTIVVNNSTFGKSGSTVELWAGGTSGKPRDRASKTGYYLRKHINETLDLQLGQTATRQWVLFRLSEIYLNYAEAMNEAYGPEQTGSGTLTVSARSALNSVRTRAAVGLSAIPAGSTPAAMREMIRRERRIELAFEGHRFFDIKRWMIAGTAIGGQLTGVDITKNKNGDFTYTPIVVEKRTWNDRLYYYPIPQAEISKSAGIIVQNKGW